MHVSIPVQKPDVKIIAFGDSTTLGPAGADYPEMLRDRLGEPPGSFANEGLGGETTEEGLERLQTIFDWDTYPNATVLLYWEGGNDLSEFIKTYDPLLFFSPDDPGFLFPGRFAETLDEVQSDIDAAIRLGRDAGLEVFVATFYPLISGTPECNPLPLDILIPIQAEHGNAYIDKLNERIRLAAASAGALVADVAASGIVRSADPNNYFNCNHLSAEGNAVVEAVFESVITGDR